MKDKNLEDEKPSFDNLYMMMVELYKEKFPNHDLERYVPRYREKDGVYTSLHNKVNGRYSTGCIDDKTDETELKRAG